MKHPLLLLALSLSVQPLFSQTSAQLGTSQERVSYSIGADIGNTLRRQDLDLDAKALATGLQDSLSGSTAMSEAEMREVLAAYQQQISAKMQARENAAAEENGKAGKAFLEQNADKEGVTVLPSGLQYRVLKSGSGRTPVATDTVTTHYHGTLIDGTVFDSSVERGEPVSFPVNGVIPGWTEALQLMKEGDKWQIFIPSDLAYGPRGAGGRIGPNAALIFDVELISVQ